MPIISFVSGIFLNVCFRGLLDEVCQVGAVHCESQWKYGQGQGRQLPKDHDHNKWLECIMLQADVLSCLIQIR